MRILDNFINVQIFFAIDDLLPSFTDLILVRGHIQLIEEDGHRDEASEGLVAKHDFLDLCSVRVLCKVFASVHQGQDVYKVLTEENDEVEQLGYDCLLDA